MLTLHLGYKILENHKVQHIHCGRLITHLSLQNLKKYQPVFSGFSNYSSLYNTVKHLSTRSVLYENLAFKLIF